MYSKTRVTCRIVARTHPRSPTVTQQSPTNTPKISQRCPEQGKQRDTLAKPSQGLVQLEGRCSGPGHAAVSH
ncbi:hypothetical protein E2C01_096696 [Portunus trituberculatus]|uniref:Uncharacterized protein n=1 Tax=Portunus trituberculatus TaxID=210409 RepID=A0A5B7K7I2_PORTR|nr:hypothetical protein [Portunus trituberculatus]